MKRLALPIVAAVALHLFVFSLDVSLKRQEPRLAGTAREVGVTLRRRQNLEQTTEAKAEIAPEKPVKKVIGKSAAPVSEEVIDHHDEEASALQRAPVVMEKAEDVAESQSSQPAVTTEKKATAEVNHAAEAVAGQSGIDQDRDGDIGDESAAIDNATAGDINLAARPLYRSNPAPQYPGLARRRAYEGTVLLEVLVAENGAAVAVRLADSSGYPILDRAALAAVRKWLFAPGIRGGRKVEMWVRVPVRFELGL